MPPKVTLSIFLALFAIFVSPTTRAADDSSAGSNNCPQSSSFQTTKLSNGKKYYFETNGLTWLNAKKHCEDNKMHLLSIESRAQLKELHVSAKSIAGNVWWLAATDIGREPGRFEWGNGQTLAQDSPLWRDGQPSSYRTTNESCVFFSSHFNEKLWDADCNFKYYSVCELNEGC